MEVQTPHEAVHGHTLDISSLTMFEFYEPIWYYDQTATFPEPKSQLARWLRDAHDFGQAICYWILPASGIPIVCSSIQPITDEQHCTDEVKKELMTLNAMINEKLGSQNTEDPDSVHGYDLNHVPDHITPEYTPFKPEAPMPQADEWDAEAYDKYISAEVLLPKNGESILGKVLAQKHDHDGNPIGKYNTNPILDTRIYDVISPDGITAEYSANIIAECCYSQVGNEGNQYVLLDDNIDWKTTPDAVDDSQFFQVSAKGNIHKHHTTKGWRLCILWKDESTLWEALNDLKESFSVQVAEFAVANNLQEGPALVIPSTSSRVCCGQ
jgi:hypothetical protein